MTEEAHVIPRTDIRKPLCGAPVFIKTPLITSQQYLNGWGEYIYCDRCNELMALKQLARTEL